MALFGFLPWVTVALLTNAVAKSRGASGRRRLGLILLEYLAIVVALVLLFSIPGVGPQNSYGDRDFPQEQADSHGKKHGVYAPIPFGPTEQDDKWRFRPPGFNVLDELDSQWQADKEKAAAKLDRRGNTAAWNAGYDRTHPRPTAADLSKSNESYTHWLGTVNAGDDVLSRLIYGTRISMTVGFVAVSIYMVIGVIAGALAGYFGGIVDILISRAIEVVLLFPAFFLILTLVALLGQSIYIIMVVIGITGWPTVARLIRGEVLKQRSLDYTLAAQALGASHLRIVFRHILPNSLSPALVAAPFGIAGAIITEAGLSLLGFGVQIPAPSWGRLLNVAQDNYANWWLVVVPSVAIFVTVTVFNLVGNGLRDAMDPRLRI